MPPTTAALARGLAPGVLISLTSLATRHACGRISSVGAAQDVPLRPPAWVFGVVWPILYVTTGLAWYRAPRSLDPHFALIIGLCCAWLVVYVCARAKRAAATILVAAMALAAHTAWRAPARTQAPLVPLALWLAFAAYLNVAEAVMVSATD